MNIRSATLQDLDFLLFLEQSCFPARRCDGRKSLRHSITSPHQKVLILEQQDKEKKKVSSVGSAVLFRYKNTVRIYSIAILPNHQGHGYGDYLMQAIIKFALTHHYSYLSLESDANATKLLKWYQRYGFSERYQLDDYYAAGEHAVRMIKSLA